MRKIKTRKQIIDETVAGLKEAMVAHKINIELYEKLGEIGWEQQNSKRQLEIGRAEKMIEILKSM